MLQGYPERKKMHTAKYQSVQGWLDLSVHFQKDQKLVLFALNTTNL